MLLRETDGSSVVICDCQIKKKSAGRCQKARFDYYPLLSFWWAEPWLQRQNLREWKLLRFQDKDKIHLDGHVSLVVVKCCRWLESWETSEPASLLCSCSTWPGAGCRSTAALACWEGLISLLKELIGSIWQLCGMFTHALDTGSEQVLKGCRWHGVHVSSKVSFLINS